MKNSASKLSLVSVAVISNLLTACGGDSETINSPPAIAQEASTPEVVINTQKTDIILSTAENGIALVSLPTTSKNKITSDKTTVNNPQTSKNRATEATSVALEIDNITPADRNNKVVVGSDISITFGDSILMSSVNDSTAITVIERTNGNNVDGEISISGFNTLVFTPSQTLKNRTIYTVNVTSGITSENGQVFEGTSWVFATLFDVGNTTQETVNTCGNNTALYYVGLANRERSLTQHSTIIATLNL